MLLDSRSIQSRLEDFPDAGVEAQRRELSEPAFHRSRRAGVLYEKIVKQISHRLISKSEVNLTPSNIEKE